MGDFAVLHPDKPGALEWRDTRTRRYRVARNVGPFYVREEFSAWAWGEVFAWVEGLGRAGGPICTNDQLREWIKSGDLELL